MQTPAADVVFLEIGGNSGIHSDKSSREFLVEKCLSSSCFDQKRRP